MWIIAYQVGLLALGLAAGVALVRCLTPLDEHHDA